MLKSLSLYTQSDAYVDISTIDALTNCHGYVMFWSVCCLCFDWLAFFPCICFYISGQVSKTVYTPINALQHCAYRSC